MNAKVKPMVSSDPGIRLSYREGDVDPGVQDINRVLTVLGSGTGCDIVLDSDRVDHVHAAIVRLGEVAYVCDLGGAGGTRINQRFVRWERLNDGDELGLGPFVFDVEIEAPRHAIVATTRPFSLREDQAFGVVRSEDPVLLIGSDATCDIVLGGSMVAPRHAIVVWGNDGPIVRDLTGERTTRVNGKWVREAALRHGDSIGVGSYELIFEVGSAPATEHAPRPRAEGASNATQSGPGRMVAGKVPARPAEIPLKSLEDESIEIAEPASRTFDHLNEEQASIEMVRAMDALSRDRSSEAPVDLSEESYEGAEPLNDSEVLELLEDVEEVEEATMASTNAAPHRQAGAAGRNGNVKTPGGNRTEAVDLIAAERLVTEYGDNLSKCPPDLKARVVAAQNALDERARKLRSELDSERARLRACQDQLQEQARKLLAAARSKGAPAEGAFQSLDSEAGQAIDAPGGQSAYAGAASEDNGDGWKADVTTLERLFSGAVDLDAATRKNAGETLRAASGRPTDGNGTRSEVHSLQCQVAELAKMVREERDETRTAEARLESLKFEIERLRVDIVRSREKHRVQQTEHEARYQALQRSLAAVKHERESLMARLRRLDAKESALNSRATEADCVRKDLEHEAERISRNQELHDERVRELRVGLESERHRLRVRQAEMQRKASELAKLAKARRKAIEEIVNQQQAALKEQETELKSKRSALIEAGRAELERTATELEQLLSVRLADVESELLSRQENLEGWIHAIYDANRPASLTEAPSRENVTRLPKASAGIGAEPATVDRIGISGESRHLATLESELEGLHRAVLRLEEDSDRKTVPLTQTPAYSNYSEGPPAWSRPTRWSGGLTSRLSEKLSSLRTGIEDIARSVSSSKLSTEAGGIDEKLDAAASGSI